jgi:hypothetical protein
MKSRNRSEKSNKATSKK